MNSFTFISPDISVYPNILLDDRCVKSATMSLQNAMVAESLSADTLTIRTIDKYIVSGSLVDGIPVDQLQYGEQMLVRPNDDNTDLRRFYLRSYKKVGGTDWEFDLVSAVGMLSNIEHKGGVYNGQTVEQVVKGYYDSAAGRWVEGIIPWMEEPATPSSQVVLKYGAFIDADVAAVQLYGWLPIASARDNLVQVLFSCGASIMKWETSPYNGYMWIKFNAPTQTDLELDGDIVAMSGRSADYVTPATSVTVVEHTFAESSETVETVLFDNRDLSLPAASNYYLEFSEPYSALSATDLTIAESGANYAIVSGRGYLTGKAYTHGQRKVTVSTGVSGEPSERVVSDCTLINPFNIDNVVERVKSYYSVAINDTLIAHEYRIRPGMFISYPDPADSSQTKYGYVMNVEANFGKEMTQRVTIAADWKPSYVGNTFNTSILVKASDLVNGKWTVPQGCGNQPARIVLVGGGDGGNGSSRGSAGGNVTYSEQAGRNVSPLGVETYVEGSVYYKETSDDPLVWEGGKGGEGGEGGTGGNAGKIYDFPLTLGAVGTQYAVTIGTGGNGGSADGGTPSSGTATTFAVGGTTYTSANGTPPAVSYIDMINGDVYAQKGKDGVKGGNGGGAGEYETTEAPLIHENGSKSYFSRHPLGGEDGESTAYAGGKGSKHLWFEDGNFAKVCYGSGGGGASTTNSGTNATLPTADEYGDPQSEFLTTAGSGGNATQPPNASLGGGGRGADGGGGSGGVGAYVRLRYVDGVWKVSGDSLVNGTAGSVGLGAKGGKGGDGFVLIYTHDTELD